MNTFTHPVIGQLAVIPEYGLGTVVEFHDDNESRRIFVKVNHVTRWFDPENVKLVKIEYQDGPTLQDEIVELKVKLVDTRQKCDIELRHNSRIIRAQDDAISKLKSDLENAADKSQTQSNIIVNLRGELNTQKEKAQKIHNIILGGF